MFIISCVFSMGLLPIHSAWGRAVVFENQKLLASDGAERGSFGSSVSLSGDLALVGILTETAYVFKNCSVRSGIGSAPRIALHDVNVGSGPTTDAKGGQPPEHIRLTQWRARIVCPGGGLWGSPLGHGRGFKVR